jgi:site-specific DNA-methyltransferase (adenine-specific)
MQNLINKIHNCDCLDLIKKLNNNSIDLIITDPPYGVNFNKNTLYNDSKDYVFGNIDNWIDGMYNVLKENSHIYIFVPTLEIDRWVFAIKKKFIFNNILTFPTYTTNRYLKSNYNFISQFVIFASKGKSKELNKIDWIKTSKDWLKDKRNHNPKEYTYAYPNFFNNIRANTKNNKHKKTIHPNSKNIELCEKLILISSEKNDIVLDIFSGSGNILQAAKNMERQYIGCENNKEIFNKINLI